MAWLIVNWGWRSALIFVATATLVICLPLAWFFLRDKPPEHYGLQPDGGAPIKQGIEKLTFAEYNFTPVEAMRTKSFWMLLVSFMLDGGILTMVTMHQMPYLQDMGIDPIAAAGILGLMATMSLPGRVVFAWVGDRWGDRLSIILGYVLKTMGLIVFIIARDIPMLILFVVLFGTGYGGVMPTKSSIRAAYFGRKSFATITGWTNFFSAISGVAYPIFAGWSYDVSGSYIFSFSVITVFQAVAIVFMVFATRPNPPKGVNMASEVATT
jgi:MFS family permease